MILFTPFCKMKARLGVVLLTWLHLSTEIYHQGQEATRLGDKLIGMTPPLSWHEISRVIISPKVSITAQLP